MKYFNKKFRLFFLLSFLVFLMGLFFLVFEAVRFQNQKTQQIQMSLAYLSPLKTKYISLSSAESLCNEIALTSLGVKSNELKIPESLNIHNYFLVFEDEKLFLIENGEWIEIYPDYNYLAKNDFHSLDFYKHILIPAVREFRLESGNNISSFVFSERRNLSELSMICSLIDNSFLKNVFD